MLGIPTVLVVAGVVGLTLRSINHSTAPVSTATNSASSNTGRCAFTNEGSSISSYLYKSPTFVIFVQFSGSGSYGPGSLVIDNADTNSQPAVHESHKSFTAEINGSDVQLFTGGTTLAGSFSTTDCTTILTLNLQDPQGVLVPYTLTAASSDDFNAGLAILNQNAGSAQASQAAEKSQAAAASASAASSAAQALTDQAQRSCIVIGGHLAPGNLCGSNKTGTPCDAAFVWLNTDESVNRSDLSTTKESFPGCFP